MLLEAAPGIGDQRRVPFKVATLWRGSFKAQMLSFRIILDHFKPKAAQTTKWSVVVQRLNYFVPKAIMVHMVPCTQMFQAVLVAL